MAIRFRCPFCKKTLKLIKSEKMGQPMQCPNEECGKWIIIGAAAAPSLHDDAETRSAPEFRAPAAIRPHGESRGAGPAGFAPTVPRAEATAPQPQKEWAEKRPEVFESDPMYNKFKRPPAPPPLPANGAQLGAQSFDSEDPPFLSLADALPPPLRDQMNGVPPAPRPFTPQLRQQRKGLPILPIAIGLFVLIGLGIGAYFLFSGGKNEESTTITKGSFGVIEIGSKGIKALVVEPYLVKDSYDFKIHKKYDDLNVSAGRLMEDGKQFDPKSLEFARNSVREFFTNMRDQQQLPPERIAVIRSSGVIAGFKDPIALEENRKALNAVVREITGSDLEGFTPFYEARYTALFLVPKPVRAESLLLDFGSGNIKGGFFTADNQFTGTNVDAGTSLFAKAVDKKMKEDKSTLAQVAPLLAEKLIAAPLQDDISRNGAFQLRKRIFLSGGLTWALRMYTHPNDPLKQNYVDLKAEDIEKFKKLVMENNPEQILALVLAEVNNADQRAALKEVLTKIQGVFNIHELRCGAHSLEAVARTYDFKNKLLTFYNEGPTAPIMGYVLTRVGLER